MKFCQLFLIFSSVYLANGGPVKRTVPLAQGMPGPPQDTQIGTEQGTVSVAPNNENTNNNIIPNNGVVSNAPTINGDSNDTPNAVTNGANADATNAGTTNTEIAVQGKADAANTETAVQGKADAANTETAVQGKTGAENAETVIQGAAEGTPTVDAKLDEDHQVKPVAEKGELQQTMIHPGGEVEKVFSGTPEEVAASDHKGNKQPLHTIVKPNGEIEKVYVGTPTDNKKILNKERKVMKEATATLAHDTFNISIPLKPRKPPVIKYIGNETEGVYVKSPASENFKTICIMEHNKKRLIHNAHPLVWSDKLAESAQSWADHLAEIDDDLPDTTNRKYGENIFWTRPQLPEDELCKAAVDEWYNEVKLYDFSASHKRNYDADPVNEFTQLVYDGQTREVGVAFSLSRTNKQYVVARYYKKRNPLMLDSEIHPAHSDRSRVRFDRPIFQTYNMIVRIPRTSWVPQYKQPHSPAFQRLESKMKNAFKATFQESPTVTSLVDFKLNTFKLDDRQPSSSAILADLDVKFYPYVKDPIQRLKSSIFHGQLNGMELDDNFLKVFNKTGVYMPPPSWRDKMEKTDLQADLLRPPNNVATDPITGAPTNVKYPQPISEDIDLLDRKPCQGGICETYLIKDRSKEPATNTSATSPIPTVPANATPAIQPPPNGFAQPCCNQMPPPQPCLALACPPASPMPACNPNCRPHPTGMWPSALYRRGGIAFEHQKNKNTENT